MLKTKIFLLLFVFFVLVTGVFAFDTYDYSDAPGYDQAHNRGYNNSETWQWYGPTWGPDSGPRYDDGDLSDDGIWWSTTGENGAYGHDPVLLGQNIWLKFEAHEVASNYWTDRIRIWIDWDGDKLFSNPGELAVALDWMEGVNPNNDWTHVVPLIVPYNAYVGTTYLRARISCNAGGAYRFPYGNTSQGEVEDWALEIHNEEVPEPATLLLSLAGLIGIGASRRRFLRKKK